MFIRCGNKYMEITDPMQSIKLEIKFNLTSNGKVWSKIGDALYYFKDIEVESSQFNFIIELAKIHLAQCTYSIVL